MDRHPRYWHRKPTNETMRKRRWLGVYALPPLLYLRSSDLLHNGHLIIKFTSRSLFHIITNHGSDQWADIEKAVRTTTLGHRNGICNDTRALRKDSISKDRKDK